MNRFLLPLGLFIVLVALLAVGLTLNPREVPSPLINKPAPAFTLAHLHDPGKTVTREEMLGKVWLLNVWASWCPSCREEHPVFNAYAQRADAIPVIGLNWKDKREDGLRWLARFGDPYTASAYDNDGRVGIDFGVYGAPETFLIDKNGVIRYKKIGTVTPEVLEKEILPKIRELSQ
jgi:cytochrome c biogenesis protein CcmG, thiol:disulfide interchange protein DsbE